VKKEKILVVDDLPDVRATIMGLLSDAGFEVSSASSKNDALRKLKTEKFNVAVLDIRLDETDEDNQDGLVLMHEINKCYPRTATIILTGYADVRMVREALQPDQNGISPAFGFLEKTELDQLGEYVNRALAHTVINGSFSTKDLISQGENEHVEFKSSIRWDYKTKAEDRSIKLVIAKAIVGFLNAKGGTLLVGIADNGMIVGIEKDLETFPKRSSDEFQLSLTDIISNYIGVEHLSRIHPRFESVNNRLICAIVIEKSPNPVFLKGDDNKLWVRAGNSTRYLGVKAAMSYIEANWKKTL
jgi:FixJ family two-component response regulator